MLLTLFYFLVVEQVLQGMYNLWDGLRWLRMAQRRIGSHAGFYAPRVALICPVKGVEPGLEQNLAALTSFDYPDYDIFFALASARTQPARFSTSSRLPANTAYTSLSPGGPRDAERK